jgi:hypothetical protein
VSEEVDLDSQRVAVVDPTAAQVLVLEGAENHSMTTRTDLRATRTPNRPSPHRCLWRSPRPVHRPDRSRPDAQLSASISESYAIRSTVPIRCSNSV